MHYYEWCPKCKKTSRYSTNQIGEYNYNPDYGCDCKTPKIYWEKQQWNHFKKIIPELPRKPKKGQPYNLNINQEIVTTDTLENLGMLVSQITAF